ncbi:MAG: hypothetical protein QOG92_805 [Verrucomicrobiota bacterium]|jgi:NAD(P)H-binding|nr:hypothetical protein [Verrucomicrobiota bacterium]
MNIKRNGSQASGKGNTDWFTGTVRIDQPFQAEEPARVGGATVTFEPGARTASHSGGKVGAKTVDYGGVRNVLTALGKSKARIALMTAIGVTNRTGSYNRETESHDWKRRAERLVRRSGNEYTIVRPGWFLDPVYGLAE